jgi:hypothetical protein
MKKTLAMLLVLMIVFGMSVTALAEGNYKIAILTGTTSQNEEEFRAAQRAQAEDPDHVITDTYPDSFMAEMETTVSKITAFAADPEVKAIIMCQAVPGCKAGFDKVREMGRDDILLIAGSPQEDPAAISASTDVLLYADEIRQGDTIMETCSKWGIDVFIHYSFPRHMAMEMIVARHELFKKNAEALGIEFVDVTAPDPTAEAGMSASQQFILEDVPQQMAKYAGKKVAFFCTNCGMQEPLQAAILAQPNAYYPQPCCPSPYHAFPAVLGLELELGGDDTAALKAIAAKLKESNAVDRFSTWKSPIAMTEIAVGVDYARAWINGEIKERNDRAALEKLLNARIEGAQINTYVNADGTEFPNYYLMLLAPVDFNDYL